METVEEIHGPANRARQGASRPQRVPRRYAPVPARVECSHEDEHSIGAIAFGSTLADAQKAPTEPRRARQARLVATTQPHALAKATALISARLSKAENLQIKAGVARAIESGQPPLTAALQAMKNAWALGGPTAAARFAVLCLPHCHKRLPRRRVGPEDLLP